MARTESDFYQKLAAQMRFIRSSSLAYDAGHIEEAQRLSAAVSIVLDSRRNGKSIIDHLGIAEHIPMLSTGRSIRQGNLIGESKLTELVNLGYSNCRHVPNLAGDPAREINGLESIEEWLDSVVIALGNDTLSRRDIIRSLRDNDGGSHVDAERRNKIYRSIVENHYMTVIIGDEPVIGLEWAVMRQIAYEAECSILYNYSCRVNSKPSFKLSSETLASSDRGWIMPMAVAVDMNDERPYAKIVIENYGGVESEVHISVHAGVGEVRFFERLQFIAKARAKLSPKGSEALGAYLSPLNAENLTALKNGAKFLNFVVQVQYLSGPARPTEQHAFTFHINAQYGFAARQMRFPGVQ